MLSGPLRTACYETTARDRLHSADMRLRESDRSRRPLPLRWKHEHVEVINNTIHAQFRNVIKRSPFDVSNIGGVLQRSRTDPRCDARAPFVPHS